jgi:OOP family OmpA-OmpF porin/outer membrane immunogenic protein
MTKYVTTTLALAAALGFSVAHADGQGAFVEADAGHASTHHTGTTWGVSGGYRWTAVQSLYVGVEGGYQDLGTSKFHTVSGPTSLTDITGPHTITADTHSRNGAKAATLGLNVRWDFSERTSGLIRGGIARYRNRARSSNTSVIDNNPPVSSTYGYTLYDTRWYVGAGYGFDVSPNLSLKFTYDYYPQHYSVYGYHFTQDTNVWSTGVEFRF